MPQVILFLDHASRHHGALPKEEATNHAIVLIKTLRSIRALTKKVGLNSSEPISRFPISDEWNIGAVLIGKEFTEEWLYLRALGDRSPISEGLGELLDEVSATECRSLPGKVNSIALAWASYMQTGTVSIAGHPDWKGPWVRAQLDQLDQLGNLMPPATIEVRNTSAPDHIKTHKDWLLALVNSNAPTDVWQDKNDRWPRLRFLDRVEKDLIALSGSGVAYDAAIGAINDLNADAINWQKIGGAPIYTGKATPEGEKRQNLCYALDSATAKSELFDWHVRFTGGAGRVHFRVDGAKHQFVVAYVGSKLERPIE